MLEYNKNYAVLALNCMLKNSKRVLGIEKKDRDKNVIK